MTGAAIVGLGMSELGKVYGTSATGFAIEAVLGAVRDAGLQVSDVDGLLISSGATQGVGLGLASVLNLRSLTLLAHVNAYGASAGAMVQQAAAAIASGHATTVVCVFADAPLKPKERTGAAWASSARGRGLRGINGWKLASGATNPNALYALCARRHMDQFGTTSEQLAEIAVAQRAWAAGNPLAAFRTPLTVADHQESRPIADPLRLLDCCLVSNGGIAVVVTASNRAKDMRQPAVHIWGSGQAHEPRDLSRGSNWGVSTPAVRSGRQAMARAEITPADVDICELYDCYTYTVLVTLEDYGFCAKGEGGEFVAGGALAPGERLACNTGGGQLSSHYMWGMTPVSEAIIQARGHGGERQAPRNDVILVSGNGGILEHHSTLVLSPLEKQRHSREVVA